MKESSGTKKLHFLWPVQDIQERLLIAVQKLEEKVETLEKERETDQQKIAKLETDLLEGTLSKSTSLGSYINYFFRYQILRLCQTYSCDLRTTGFLFPNIIIPTPSCQV